MRDPDMEQGFPWILFLIITGVSFLAFSAALKILNGFVPVFFSWIGIISLTSGCLAGILSILIDRKEKHRSH